MTETISKKKNYSIDMTTGSVFIKMIRFAVPVMLSGILQLLFNAADIIVVGRFVGHNALAAVGSNTSLIFLLTNIFIGLSVGATAVAAMFFGKNEQKNFEETVHTSIALSLISGLIVMVFGLIFARLVLVLMQTPDDILDMAVLYFRIIMCGIPGSMLFNFGSAILKSVGDSKRPLYFLIISGILNVILNLVLVIVFNMGVAGVAIATIVSYYLSAVLVVICLIKDSDLLHLNIQRIRFVKSKVIAICKIGLPAGFQAALFSISNVIIQSSINSFDSSVIVAGNSAAVNLEAFVFNAMEAFYAATLTFSSQNYAIGNLKRVDKSVIWGVVGAFITGVVMCAFMLWKGEFFLSFYSTDPDVIAAGMVRLVIICSTYYICGIMDVFTGGLRGINCSVPPMIICIGGICGFRLLWLATYFKNPLHHTVEAIYYSYPLSWIITLVLLFLCYLIMRKRVVTRDAMINILKRKKEENAKN